MREFAVNFEKTIQYLNNEVHPHPDKKEKKFVIEILEKGQGYLTKNKPVEVVFFDNNAVK